MVFSKKAKMKYHIFCVIGKNEIYFFLKFSFTFSSQKSILKCDILCMTGKDIVSFRCNYGITFWSKIE